MTGTFARTYRTEELFANKLTANKTDQNHNSFLEEVYSTYLNHEMNYFIDLFL